MQEILKTKKLFQGPFFRVSPEDKWHWIKDCPDFPKAPDPQAMISSVFPDDSVLCKKCIELYRDALVREFSNK